MRKKQGVPLPTSIDVLSLHLHVRACLPTERRGWPCIPTTFPRIPTNNSSAHPPPCINTMLGRPRIKELAAPTHASLLSSSDNPPQPLLCLFPHPHKALRGARFIPSTPPTNVRRTDKDGAKSISKQKVMRAVGVTGA